MNLTYKPYILTLHINQFGPNLKSYIKIKKKVTRNVDEWVESFYNWFQPSNDIMTDNFDVFVYRNPHIFPRAHEKLELLGFLDYTNHNAHIIVYSMLPISCTIVY